MYILPIKIIIIIKVSANSCYWKEFWIFHPNTEVRFLLDFENILSSRYRYAAQRIVYIQLQIFGEWPFYEIQLKLCYLICSWSVCRE